MNSSPNGVSVHRSGGGAGIAHHRGIALSGKIMLSIILALFSVVLFILLLHFYVRWHVRRSASRRLRQRRRVIFTGEGQAHPLSAACRSLDPAVLQSLPVLLFCSGAGDDEEQGECTVCLNYFEEGEKIRSLPRCGHRFHAECIDMWFYSHSNCPLCRATVEAANEAEPPACNSSLIPNLCPSCREEDDAIGSSSSDSGDGELQIAVPAMGAEGTGGQEERGEHNQTPKGPGSSIVLLLRHLMRDFRPHRIGSSNVEPDLERGEGAAPPAPSRPGAPAL
ncbi:RING-H2 finger protein ATL2 [Apostasia shenzhenica]|uniref:RING-type E3 ubiquitin transferase n=1 Tax=Apostasia shenzhenica TaxID=1088818 RepID=A0A2I0B360_9ASPA|nr:RING-H2 finger protein ATL2 [Apostasia shenzhenica]